MSVYLISGHRLMAGIYGLDPCLITKIKSYQYSTPE